MKIELFDCMKTCDVPFFVHRAGDCQTVVLRIQIPLRDTRYVGRADGPYVSGIGIDEVETEAVNFRVNEESGDLAARFERENETAGEKILCILELIHRDGLFNDAVNLAEQSLDGELHIFRRCADESHESSRIHTSRARDA